MPAENQSPHGANQKRNPSLMNHDGDVHERVKQVRFESAAKEIMRDSVSEAMHQVVRKGAARDAESTNNLRNYRTKSTQPSEHVPAAGEIESDQHTSTTTNNRRQMVVNSNRGQPLQRNQAASDRQTSHDADQERNTAMNDRIDRHMEGLIEAFQTLELQQPADDKEIAMNKRLEELTRNSKQFVKELQKLKQSQPASQMEIARNSRIEQLMKVVEDHENAMNNRRETAIDNMLEELLQHIKYAQANSDKEMKHLQEAAQHFERGKECLEAARKEHAAANTGNKLTHPPNSTLRFKHLNVMSTEPMTTDPAGDSLTVHVGAGHDRDTIIVLATPVKPIDCPPHKVLRFKDLNIVSSEPMAFDTVDVLTLRVGAGHNRDMAIQLSTEEPAPDWYKEKEPLEKEEGMGATTAGTGGLPSRREQRRTLEGRPWFADHNTRTTTRVNLRPWV